MISGARESTPFAFRRQLVRRPDIAIMVSYTEAPDKTARPRPEAYERLRGDRRLTVTKLEEMILGLQVVLPDEEVTLDLPGETP